MLATIASSSIAHQVLPKPGVGFPDKPAVSNRKCACRDSRKSLAPMPRNIIEKASEVSPNQVIWLESCCHDRFDAPNHETDVDSVGQQERRVAAALANSCALIAAYCRVDAVSSMIPDRHLSRLPGLQQVPRTHAGSSNSMQHQTTAPIQPGWLQARAARRQKVLVGLVRASSDGHFVGTLDAIMIHPGLQRRGLGRRLVMKACSKLFYNGVTDIGACGTADSEDFFRHCGFTKDKFNSVAMMLDRTSPSGQLLSSSAKANTALDEQLVQDTRDMQESCKMNRVEQALLRYVAPA